VIALPSADVALVRDYERQVYVAERQDEALQRHRYLPEAPCVAFGSALEPFSAICSCELPVEASAAMPGDDDAPLSR